MRFVSDDPTPTTDVGWTPRRKRLFHLALVFAAVVVFVPTRGWARDFTAPLSAEEKRQRALRLGKEGVEAYNGKRYEDALDRFTAAERTVHSPVFVLYLARIQKRQGKWVAALGTYQDLLAEKVPQSSPAPWQHAQQDGRAERKALEAKIPTIQLTGREDWKGFGAWVDGKFITDLAKPIRVDPGRHEVVVMRGDQSLRSIIVSKEGTPSKVDVSSLPAPTAPETTPDRVRDPNAPPGPNGDGVNDARPSGPAPLSAGQLVPERRGDSPADEEGGADPAAVAGTITLIVGVSAAVASVALAGVALAESSRIGDLCIEDVCPGALADDVAQYDNIQIASLVMSGVAVVGIVGGAILLNAGNDSSPRVGLRVTPGGLFVEGTF